MATAIIEEPHRMGSIIDAYPVNIEVTPNTGNEHLREIGAIGSLLVELIRDTCGLSGRISVEDTLEGIRIRVEPKNQHPTPLALVGGE